MRVGAGGPRARPAGAVRSPERGTRRSPTGADGLFVIDGLKPGQVYDLSVFGGAGLGPQKRGVVAPAADVDIVVAGTGRIAGTALDARSGQPLKNFSVSYEPDRGGGAIIRIVARGAGARRASARSATSRPRTARSRSRTCRRERGPSSSTPRAISRRASRISSSRRTDRRTASRCARRRASSSRAASRTRRTGRPVANASITHEAAGSGGPGGFGGRWPRSRASTAPTTSRRTPRATSRSKESPSGA